MSVIIVRHKIEQTQTNHTNATNTVFPAAVLFGILDEYSNVVQNRLFFMRSFEGPSFRQACGETFLLGVKRRKEKSVSSHYLTDQIIASNVHVGQSKPSSIMAMARENPPVAKITPLNWDGHFR